MKINVEVDIEPEELRRLIGLPDMQPLWEAVYTRVSDGDTELIQSLAKSALNEGMKTLDVTSRFLKGFVKKDKEAEKKSPIKTTAEAAAAAAKAATGTRRRSSSSTKEKE
ncbi:hypothetical protein IB286_11245 [Spongiibacter sp. KMU-158]|uniref:Uncharacterized protein n=1 Tax=Spongiibacter pelagi TaxID=2760804 RepID=A0A927C4G1_9GAMM|nr:DUF6489 family protein [Spongiibacter pelagi]MBD2859581.1 hypothetical protein [Spongiibacter pelagi]